MPDELLISRKLSQLKEYVNVLKQANDINWQKYTTDCRSKAFVERYIHLSIETVFDIANHIISFHGFREPEEYRDLFNILNENNILPVESVDTFKKMVSFRNMLVHRYDKIDDAVVFGIFKKRLKDFIWFSDCIKKWTIQSNSFSGNH